jgi:predicted enzyme related to lactoylglutathione lyase
MTATIGLVLDCTVPTELAQFWSEALGYTTLGGVGSYVMLVDPDRVRPKLLLQAVPEAKAVKNRMHLDIEIPDVEGEACRLESLGARRLEAGLLSEHGSNWVIMADPEGNEFCVCDAGSG